MFAYMIALYVNCPHCGTGKIQLKPHLKETLAVIVRAKGEITAPEVHRELFKDAPTPPSIPSVNGRMNELTEYGYLVRRTEGRKVWYKLAPMYEHLRVRPDNKFYFAKQTSTTNVRTRRRTTTGAGQPATA